MNRDTSDHTGHRILIVDDDLGFAQTIAEALTAGGYQPSIVGSRADSEQAVAAAQYDLVLVDYQLPDGNGLGLADWLRVRQPTCPIIMTTGYGTEELRQQSKDSGIVTFLEKPFEIGLLTSFLDGLFHAPGFSGRVRDLDLLDYLQLVTGTAKSKVLHITTRDRIGRLWIEQGQIVHAECGVDRGLEAFYRLMSQKGGAFQDLPFEPPDARSVTEPTAYLLMQAAQSRDEQAMRDSDAPVQFANASAETQTQVNLSRMGDSVGGEKVGDRGGMDRVGAASERVRAPIFNPYRRFLDGLGMLPGVRGSLLLSQGGLTIARGGEFPVGQESLLYVLSEAFHDVGESLDLGRSDCGSLRMADGSELLIEAVQDYLLGVWLEDTHNATEVHAWVKELSNELG